MIAFARQFGPLNALLGAFILAMTAALAAPARTAPDPAPAQAEIAAALQ